MILHVEKLYIFRSFNNRILFPFLVILLSNDWKAAFALHVDKNSCLLLIWGCTHGKPCLDLWVILWNLVASSEAIYGIFGLIDWMENIDWSVQVEHCAQKYICICFWYEKWSNWFHDSKCASFVRRKWWTQTCASFGKRREKKMNKWWAQKTDAEVFQLIFSSNSIFCVCVPCFSLFYCLFKKRVVRHLKNIV